VPDREKEEAREALILIKSSPLSPGRAGGVDPLSHIGHQYGPKLIAVLPVMPDAGRRSFDEHLGSKTIFDSQE
jgi:hypothetical protein